MKTGIKEQETKYFVNKEQGTVVCVIKGYLRFGDSFTVRGIAKCHDDDEFNETVGRRLAESRAKQKMFKFAKKEAEKYYNRAIRPITDLITGMISANNHCHLAEIKHSEDILQGV